MNLGLIKVGLKVITGLGVSTVIDRGVAMMTPTNIKGAKKVFMKVGGFVLSSMVVTKATDYVEEVITETVQQIKDLRKPKEVVFAVKEEEA